MTGFEANTQPWSTMSPDKLLDNRMQVAKDAQLIKEGKLKRMIWFGTEPLPDQGPGALLKADLKENNIEYWHVPAEE
jgi:hypothetical protein